MRQYGHVGTGSRISSQDRLEVLLFILDIINEVRLWFVFFRVAGLSMDNLPSNLG